MAIDVFQSNILHESKSHFVRFRTQHKAARVTIKAMDDAEAVLLCPARRRGFPCRSAR